jgi:hypothetical protein
MAWRGVLSLILLIAPGASADVRAVGRYKDWLVYTETVGRDTICYAATHPIDKAPKNVDHGDVNFFVATWKSGSAVNQPSLKVGYDLRQDLPTQAVIGRETFRLFASGAEAFAPDAREAALLAALRKGAELRVETAGARTARTAYHFSLRGSNEAIDKARSLCR